MAVEFIENFDKKFKGKLEKGHEEIVSKAVPIIGWFTCIHNHILYPFIIIIDFYQFMDQLIKIKDVDNL